MEELNLRDSPVEQLIEDVNKSLIYTYDADGKPKKIKQLIKNHEIVMEHDERIAGKIRYNEFSHQPYLYGSVPWEEEDNCRAWNSGDDSALFSMIQCDYGLNSRQDFFDAMKNVAMRHKFHPIKDLLNSFQWDALSLVELRGKEKEIERDLTDGIDTRGGNMTLNQLFELFMKTKASIRESTRCNYENFWTISIRPSVIGEMKICQIKQIHLKKLYAELKAKGTKNSTIQVYHVLISAVFQLAVDNDFIRKNPCKNCRKDMKKESTPRQALTIKEQETLLDFVANSDTYCGNLPVLKFALATGLRIGELAGLRFDDIDMQYNVIHVRRQLIYRNYAGKGYEFHAEPPKSSSGVRDVPLTTTAKESLIEQKKLDLILGKRAKERSVDGLKGFIFINSNGNPVLTINFDTMLKNVVRAYNKKESLAAEKEHREPVLLPHISAHILRHTACTRMAEAGIDPKVLQAIMGHSNISVTMDVYNHVDPLRVQREIKKMESIV